MNKEFDGTPPLPQFQIDPMRDTEFTRGQLAYFNRQLADADQLSSPEDMSRVADVVADYLFAGGDPSTLDTPPHLLHRWGQAQEVMGAYPEALQQGVLRHLTRIGNAMSDTERPRAFSRSWRAEAGEQVPTDVGVALPPDVAGRAAAWNSWLIGVIGQQGVGEQGLGRILMMPTWMSVKLARGDWLPTGNVMAEVVQGVPRIQTNVHNVHSPTPGKSLAEHWGLQSDQWVMMSHIMGKDLMDLAVQVGGPDMIDSKRLPPHVYAKSYARMLQLMDHNPDLGIPGVLSDATWAYSRTLKDLLPSPSIADLYPIVGNVVELGPADAIGRHQQLVFALQHPTLHAANEAGRYNADIAARFITRAGIEEVLRRPEIVQPPKA